VPRSTITLPDAGGTQLDTFVPTGESAHREVHRIGGSEPAEIGDVLNTGPPNTAYGVVVRPLAVEDPLPLHQSSTTLAAGASTDLDFNAPGVTGKLMHVAVASSVACRWVIKKKTAGTTIAVLFTSTRCPNAEYRPPSPEFHTVSSDGFRITVTNLEPVNIEATNGEVYATCCIDQG
jgi:hypothetical protein